MKKNLLLIITISILSNTIQAQWMPSMGNAWWIPHQIEVGSKQPNPDAWVNTYSICPVGGSMMAPNLTNHLRMVQIGKLSNNAIEDPHAPVSYDCNQVMEYIYSTDFTDQSLNLDGYDNNGRTFNFMTYVGNSIGIHQNTTVDGVLNANVLASPNGNITNIVSQDLTANTGVISNLTKNNLTNNGDYNVSGKVAIGGSASSFLKSSGVYSKYALSVNGTIICKKLHAQQTNWADKVFDKQYNLMSLSSIEKYIEIHKHLPEIPSEADVIENGIDIDEMNKLILQKVEELTLHLIKQEKKIDKLEKKLASK